MLTKIPLIVFALSCWSAASFSQTKISGKVTDGKQYLPLVNVVLSMDSITVNATTTDSLGDFVLDKLVPGKYDLSASMIGYATHTSQVTIPKNQDHLTIPEITLVEHSYALGEVVVTSQKQLLDQKTDRMVINMSGNITAVGNTVLEVLQKSPGVVVNKQLGTIAINGKSGVRLMVNEKLVQVSADVALQMLEGMNASNVERIELITTPGAKYDADGSGGIVHIVTKDNADYGTSGTLSLTLGAHWAGTIGGSANLQHRAERFAYFLDYTLIRNHNLHIMNMRRQVAVGDDLLRVVDNSRRENTTMQQNLSVGAEWNLPRRTTLNVLLSGYKRNWRLDAIANNSTDVNKDSTSHNTMRVNELNIWESGTGSVGLHHQFSEKSSVNVTMDYLFYHNDNPSDYEGDAIDNIALSKSTPIHFIISTVNFKNSNKTNVFSWDAGLKAVKASLDNNVMVRRYLSGEWIMDPMFSSRSTLKEQVFAGYLSAAWIASPKWQLDGGLRYEYTHTLITSESKEDLLKRKYGYLFPTLSLKRKISLEAGIYFTYSRRITRPTYNDIAPYVFFWGPNAFSSGNTALYPALSDAVSVGYQLKQWSVSMYYTHTKNEIVMMQPEIDKMINSLIYRSQNLEYLNTLALATSYSTSVMPWWEVQGTVVTQYQTGKTSQFSDNEDLGLYGINFTLTSTITLPKSFSVQVSGMYQSRSLSGISNFLPFGSFNAGVQKKFGQHGTLTLSMDDMLYTNLWRIRTTSSANDLDVYFKYDWHNQFVRLAYTWNLGNKKVRSVKVRSGSEDERKRVGN
ncbi:MAG: outer membrane beta-barrel protein [Chryseolinea sp.]